MSSITLHSIPFLFCKTKQWNMVLSHSILFHSTTLYQSKHSLKEWEFDKIVELFSTEGVHAIIQTPLFPSVQEDKVVWQEESNGLYSVRSGYRIAAREVVPSTHYYVQGEWNAIWKVQAPHKAQNLLRRICRGCIPTRSKLI